MKPGSRVALLIGAMALASACGPDSSQPDVDSSSLVTMTGVHGMGRGKAKVGICHRTHGANPFIPISVAEPAVHAHLAHGDGLVGGVVPGQEEMEFDATCTPIPSGCLAKSTVVCPSCSPDLLTAKTSGILGAMRQIVEFSGADALPRICPITFHLSGDAYCGPYQSGYTGTFSVDASGLGNVCLWDAEKQSRSLPFDAGHAGLIQDQLLPVHEAMHGWFVDRQGTYGIQEPFCKYVSFVISQQAGGPEYCSWFASTPDDHPDALMKHLCELGMDTARVSMTLHRTADAAASKGAALSDAEFAAVVSEVLGQDATPAFQAAGILP